jgi:FkbM family methyltransferase
MPFPAIKIHYPKIISAPAVLRFILNHPLNRRQKTRALGRFLRWQIGSRLSPGSVIIPFVNQTRLIARPGLMGATGIYYTGLYEFEEMAFVLHALRPGDRFVDVGAHIGAFSVLAAGAAGAACLAIEPVPASFAYLRDNVNLNDLGDLVKRLNLGIASRPGRLHFTTGLGAANSVVPTNLTTQISAGIDHRSIEIEVQPLDALTVEFVPTLLKVDVEGYESEVVTGGEKTLADDRLSAILIELRGHGARFGFDETAVHQRLLGYGFQPYRYTPLPDSPPFRGDSEAGRKLTLLDGINQSAGTTLYIRNIDLIRQRLVEAPRFKVLGQYI